MNGAFQLYAAGNAAVDAGPPVQAIAPYWSIANRVSWLFDFHGPSLAVDTACSASAAAIHLACEALRRGEIGAALVGGVSLLLHPRQYEVLCAMKMPSPTGQCRPFPPARTVSCPAKEWAQRCCARCGTRWPTATAYSA